MTEQPTRRRWVIKQGQLHISSDMTAAEIAERMRQYYGRVVLLDTPPARPAPAPDVLKPS